QLFPESQAPTSIQTQRRSALDNASGAKSDEAQRLAEVACDAEKRQATHAIPQLISMLGDDRETELIPCWAGSSWSPALSTFKHASPGEQAAIALASMGTPAFESLTTALQSSDPVSQRNAAWAIGELTNMAPSEQSDAVVPLISLLDDSDEWVRMAAARALGELRDERAGERLVARLFDSASGVRQTSAWALGEMKTHRAVETLSRVVVTDAQSEVRLAAAEALGEIAHSGAVAALTQALSDTAPSVRAKAKWALAEIGDDEG
ncbi:MAG TPA: HEAT repeat domain-containing protein, partial [Pyrinomonadaceae bacterium]|nr:HEAT repeat domain-containing protein [Pyrinomonadaceae bacterium]